jgi:hypothetical protein
MREEDLWFTSMEKTLIHDHEAGSGKETPMRKLAEMYHHYIWKDDFAEYGREAYKKYNDGVFRHATEAKREILLYNVTEGWKPLCTLLGKNVPDKAFPRIDAWAKYKEAHAAE